MDKNSSEKYLSFLTQSSKCEKNLEYLKWHSISARDHLSYSTVEVFVEPFGIVLYEGGINSNQKLHGFGKIYNIVTNAHIYSGFFKNNEIYSQEDIINYVGINKVTDPALLPFLKNMQDFSKKQKNQGKLKDSLYSSFNNTQNHSNIIKSKNKNSKNLIDNKQNSKLQKCHGSQNSDNKIEKSFITFGNLSYYDEALSTPTILRPTILEQSGDYERFKKLSKKKDKKVMKNSGSCCHNANSKCIMF